MGTEAAAKNSLARGWRTCARAMFEPEQQDLIEALEEVDKMDALLSRVWITTPRLLHGSTRPYGPWSARRSGAGGRRASASRTRSRCRMERRLKTTQLVAAAVKIAQEYPSSVHL